MSLHTGIARPINRITRGTVITTRLALLETTIVIIHVEACQVVLILDICWVNRSSKEQLVGRIENDVSRLIDEDILYTHLCFISHVHLQINSI